MKRGAERAGAPADEAKGRGADAAGAAARPAGAPVAAAAAPGAGALRKAKEGEAQTVRVHVWIEGQVQGVWFRESARKEAERLGVAGWVRNLPDGRVEAVLEGPEGPVAEMERWCRRGPERARVDGVETTREPAEGFSRFEVRR